ncbi:uncharacterized protein LOC143586306 [Bidens hawaiensis]|uniref:uncharacterized protein LOC143586306 n=1 Tax=Bidens hawaiensis TaxID=980011 RepID=UPI00404ADDFB
MIMSQLLTPTPVAVAATSPPSQKIVATHRNVPVLRRDVLVGTVFGLSIVSGNKSAEAGARQPPPPPPTEKNDLNVSGVLKKVLASKKRKEAMKEAIAELRNKGKAISNEPPPVSPPAEAE